VEIRKEYYKYLKNELGFRKTNIKNAWNLAQKDYPRASRFTLEVMTRDILTDFDAYREKTNRMKESRLIISN